MSATVSLDLRSETPIGAIDFLGELAMAAALVGGDGGVRWGNSRFRVLFPATVGFPACG